MNPRAEIYHSLAEAIFEPPDWIALPGNEWPLFESLKLISDYSEAARFAVSAISEIPSDSLANRRTQYRELFDKSGRPQFWLYESLHVNGKLAGPVTFEIQHLYKTMGLEIPGAELPDHASLELAFLAYLATQQDAEPEKAGLWRLLERRFIKKHAGLWLPEVGRRLAYTQDPVYGPIGELLASWLLEAVIPRKVNRPQPAVLPTMSKPENCTLCGFCVQVCPSQVLVIQETQFETRLHFSSSGCIKCAKCVRICGPGALEMHPSLNAVSSGVGWELLLSSPRATCTLCNAPTISQAEMAYVGAQLGNPVWLAYCQKCRSRYVEAIL